MQRIPEPELMDEFEQARAYAEADFAEPNERFVRYFAEEFPGLTRGAVIDLGCGPGDIVLRLARRYPDLTVHGLDGSAAMLAFGEKRLQAEPGLQSRVRFIQGRLPDARLLRPSYDAVISNSLLHHLHDPQALWQSIHRLGGPGAPVLVMDLYRPATERAARDIVETYAGGEPDVLQRDFYNSLCAAFEPGEVRAQLEACGLGTLGVRAVSDRHLLVSGRLPA
jgi:ubiquinone/menaquinone biosynthesis C-methylase UbiE